MKDSSSNNSIIKDNNNNSNNNSNNNKIKIAGNFIYSINDILGVGTWGTVYKARSKN
jgi:hypothetical protein